MGSDLHLIITGGTIDSVFDRALDAVVINDSSTIAEYINTMVNPQFTLSQEILTMRDSRKMTDNMRAEIVTAIRNAPSSHILITHGTYTMAETGCYLKRHLSDVAKTVVLTGSMLPLKGFAPSDAPFNLGFAIATAFLSKPGIHLAMNGKVFDPDDAIKNLELGRFEEVGEKGTKSATKSA